MSKKKIARLSQAELIANGLCFVEDVLFMPIPTSEEMEMGRQILGPHFSWFDDFRCGTASERKLAREKIVYQYQFLTLWITEKKYPQLGNRARKLNLTKEIYQEGMLAILRALEGYDYTRGIQFKTYASLWIRAYVVRTLAGKERKEKREHLLSPTEDGTVEEMMEILLLEHLKRGKQEKEEEEGREQEKIREYRLLRRLIDLSGKDPDAERRLDSKEKLVLLERGRKTLAEIGLAIDVSRQRVFQIEEKAIKKLPPIPRKYEDGENLDLLDEESLEIIETVLGYFDLSEEECLVENPRTKTARHCLAYLLSEVTYWPHEQIGILLHTDEQWVAAAVCNPNGIQSHLASLRRCLAWSD